ncbi:unnamed protein product, partial [marine sediment metagenome]
EQEFGLKPPTLKQEKELNSFTVAIGRNSTHIC